MQRECNQGTLPRLTPAPRPARNGRSAHWRTKSALGGMGISAEFSAGGPAIPGRRRSSSRDRPSLPTAQRRRKPLGRATRFSLLTTTNISPSCARGHAAIPFVTWANLRAAAARGVGLATVWRAQFGDRGSMHRVFVTGVSAFAPRLRVRDGFEVSQFLASGS